MEPGGLLDQTGQEAKMPTTIEKPNAAQVVAHATEYPPDREHRDQQRNQSKSNESRAHSHGLDTDPSTEEPAVVVGHEQKRDQILDGVAAYHALAQHLLERKATQRISQPSTAPVHDHAAAEINHAYEEPAGRSETHQVNLAT